jgi:hypothetical protein
MCYGLLYMDAEDPTTMKRLGNERQAEIIIVYSIKQINLYTRLVYILVYTLYILIHPYMSPLATRIKHRVTLTSK